MEKRRNYGRREKKSKEKGFRCRVSKTDKRAKVKIQVGEIVLRELKETRKRINKEKLHLGLQWLSIAKTKVLT
jgi:tRNA-binding EMAP/Myf-like protein